MPNMTAVEITAPGTPDVLQVTQRPIPTAASGEVVIKLAYAGVNRPDALQRAGLYNPPIGTSDLPGLEGAGVISEVGAGVTEWAVGDEVCALLPGGGYAQYVATCATHCLPIPQGLTLNQAACLPETYFTVYSNVFQRGGLQAGETFLVHGGSSGLAQLQSNWRICLEPACLQPPDLRRNAKLAKILVQSGSSITVMRCLKTCSNPVVVSM